MTIQRLQKLLTYALMVTAFLALQMSRELSPVVIPIFYLGIAVSWFWEEPRIDFEKWSRFWTGLTLAVFAFTLIDMIVLGEFFLISAMNFVLFLATGKMFQRAEHKDYTQAMALSLLLLAAGAVLNENLSFGMLFAVYTILATLGLTVQHLNQEVFEHHGRRGRGMRIERAVFWTTLGLAVLIFAGSVLFFFSFPRIGFGFFTSQSRRGVTTSGFGEDVELGSHGTIREDATIVMRVEFPNGPPPMEPDAIHWRGLSLDHWDGRSWSDRDDAPIEVSSVNHGYAFDVGGMPSWSEVTEGTVSAEIYLEPLDSEVLFSIGHPVAMELPNRATDVPSSLFGRMLRADRTGEVEFRTRSEFGVAYIMHSHLASASSDRMRESRWPGDFRTLGELLDAAVDQAVGDDTEIEVPPSSDVEARIRLARTAPMGELAFTDRSSDGAQYLAERYLQLPRDAITDRMAELVDALVGESEDPYTLVTTMEEYLRTELDYTTDLPEPSSDDANVIDEFLFDWQRGHCEYFATSMVLLLREAGIPSRIVNGFLGGDFNDFGDYWVVRQANAHSWVEAYFPGVGWIEFDPTPSSGALFRQRSGLLARINQFWDSLRLKWFKWVVEYDLEKQFTLLRDAFTSEDEERESGEQSAFTERLREIGFWLYRNFRALAIAIFLSILGSFFYRRRARARYRWSAVDTAFGVGWAILATVGVVHYWHGSRSIATSAVAWGPPLIGVAVAYLLRRDLFADPTQSRKSRSRGSLDVSIWYGRLLRDIEREVGALPMSITPSELVAELGIDGTAATELTAFLSFYERVRFGGHRPDDDEVSEWGSRFRKLRGAVRRAVRDAAAAREVSPSQ